MSDKSPKNTTPPFLYHTTLSIADQHRNPSNSTRKSSILGTHVDLPSARSFALSALESCLNYRPSDFEKFVTRLSWKPAEDDEWPYGDSTLVYALTKSGQEILVGLETTPNLGSLDAGGGSDGTPLIPEDSGCDHLHYVLQTTTRYDQSQNYSTGIAGRRGSLSNDAFRTTKIEGCYVPKTDALMAAREALRAEKEKGMFVQYDEREVDEDIEVQRDDDIEYGWPFGDDVVVHAVGQMGENYEVAVTTLPAAKRRGED
ncbi:hypothetical protein QBC42DRAFT_269552 [Cladorrhinum samala]|uniref:Uncharacterized protein n=1 Tax=Cladorrhinum samala TaxID=585594 RepID=A0AAV9HP13_9PEZI|nr:hypothetical protein QBC42DRAFT_269552 [Cladorrhinum samala]